METNESAFRIEEIFPFLDPYVAEWFDSNYTSLTDPQKQAIPLIHEGRNVLVSSPTGTGKTLTAFLSIINELFILARNGKLEDKIYCVYISPLKALANDIDKNLKKPLEGIYEIAERKNEKISKIKVSVRSGDTSLSERQKMSRKPPHILITTPESLSLALS
ncbi:MAG: DEAD/DEAH box helicase, partial [Thermoplasmata archaeon]